MCSHVRCNYEPCEGDAAQADDLFHIVRTAPSEQLPDSNVGPS